MNTAYQKINACVDKTMNSEISDLQKLVRIKSVENRDENGYPFGQGTHDCLELILSIARNMGFTAKNIDDMCGYVEFGSGNEMVMALSHLDVVPEGDGWTHDPYAAEIEGDRMYGRGTLDDKGPAISTLYALKAIRDSGLSIRRRIRLLFGLNEETGSKCIKYYVDHGGELPVMGFTPDAGYPVINGEKGRWTLTYHFPLKTGEGAGEILSLHGGTGTGIVPGKAYAVLSLPEDTPHSLTESLPEHVTGTWLSDGRLRVEAEGVEAHGGRPQLGENAIGRLFLALAKLPLQGESRYLCQFMSEHFGMDVTGEKMGIACQDNLSGGLTVNLGYADLNDGTLELQIGLRFPVTSNGDMIRTIFRSKMEEYGFHEVSAAGKSALFVPAECELVQTLCHVYKEYTGQDGKPRCIGGGTYAKTMPNLVAFGPNFPGDESRIHKPDEYMGLQKLRLHTQINAAALYEMAK